jgi:hypothetical protein
MLSIEPLAHCTLTDLLKGKGKMFALLCGCHHMCNTGESGVKTPLEGTARTTIMLLKMKMMEKIG